MTTPAANPNTSEATCWPCRDPSEYVLLSKLGGTQQHPDLIRLDPDAPVPPGWESVQQLHGNPVYQDDGRLQPQFWALRRYPQDFQKANPRIRRRLAKTTKELVMHNNDQKSQPAGEASPAFGGSTGGPA